MAEGKTYAKLESGRIRVRNLTTFQQIALLQRHLVHDAEKKSTDAACRARIASAWVDLENHKQRIKASRTTRKQPAEPASPEPAMVEDDPAAGDPPTA